MPDFDVKAWLEEILYGGIPRHQRICFLVVANGGLQVNGWGFLRYENGHQRGLEQNDAIDLISVSSFLRGLEVCGVDWGTVFRPYLDSYMAALEAASRQEQPSAQD